MTKTSSLLISVIALSSMFYPSVSNADIPASFFESRGSEVVEQDIEDTDESQDGIDAAADTQCAGSSCQAEALDASDTATEDRRRAVETDAAAQDSDLLAVTGAVALLLAAAAFGCLLRIRKNMDK